ncbi:MAG: PPOX class F420-dependent oxidoreductase [Dehalococcoidia bacterium]
MPTIPPSHRDILEGPNFAHIATLMKDGSPQVTPVWIDLDGDTIVFNTADGRAKARNLDRDGRVAVAAFDQKNPYRYIQIRGVVEKKVYEGADAHIDKMSRKYTGADVYAGHTDAETRVMYRIRPEHVQTMG